MAIWRYGDESIWRCADGCAQPISATPSYCELPKKSFLTRQWRVRNDRFYGKGGTAAAPLENEFKMADSVGAAAVPLL